MLLQKFLSRKKLFRKKLSIFVSKIGPATGVRPRYLNVRGSLRGRVSFSP